MSSKGLHHESPGRLGISEFFSKFVSIKYLALALLVLQNTFLVVFMRLSRTAEGPLYASSTAVFTVF